MIAPSRNSRAQASIFDYADVGVLKRGRYDERCFRCRGRPRVCPRSKCGSAHEMHGVCIRGKGVNLRVYPNESESGSLGQANWQRATYLTGLAINTLVAVG